MDPNIVIYTDGGCRDNPGRGGWGFVMIHSPTLEALERCGAAEGDTTNNRMELTAVLEALTALDAGQVVLIISDSKYVIDGATKWMARWKRKNWKRKPHPLKNVDLFKALDVQLQRHAVSWRWIRGHSGNPGNERADALANIAMDRALTGQDPMPDARGKWLARLLPLTPEKR